jgi:hypothetical protein
MTEETDPTLERLRRFLTATAEPAMPEKLHHLTADDVIASRFRSWRHLFRMTATKLAGLTAGTVLVVGLTVSAAVLVRHRAAATTATHVGSQANASPQVSVPVEAQMAADSFGLTIGPPTSPAAISADAATRIAIAESPVAGCTPNGATSYVAVVKSSYTGNHWPTNVYVVPLQCATGLPGSGGPCCGGPSNDLSLPVDHTQVVFVGPTGTEIASKWGPS